ncbi:MAG TPA: response regulator transcription factor [Candidatus Baltobacteraceae bacterium]|jgi:DNA-binding NarL/FixJ family response regulator|nr:response regulator transcription factor [Candidatus Baltobacteraceae bacterium]
MAASVHNIQQTSVMVVGKDPAVLSALAKLLSLDEEISVVGAVPSITTDAVCQADPDVIVLDGPHSSAEAAKARAYLAQVAPRSKLFPLAMLGEMTLSQLLDAIKAVSAPAAQAQTLEPNAGASARDALSSLSERELQVVRLVAEGLSNKEISSRLSLSDKTVKNHISHILAKTSLSARTQVAVYAIRAGLV